MCTSLLCFRMNERGAAAVLECQNAPVLPMGHFDLDNRRVENAQPWVLLTSVTYTPSVGFSTHGAFPLR